MDNERGTTGRAPSELRIERKIGVVTIVGWIGSVLAMAIFVGGAYTSARADRVYIKERQAQETYQRRSDIQKLEARMKRKEVRDQRRFQSLDRKLNILLRRSK